LGRFFGPCAAKADLDDPRRKFHAGPLNLLFLNSLMGKVMPSNPFDMSVFGFSVAPHESDSTKPDAPPTLGTLNRLEAILPKLTEVPADLGKLVQAVSDASVGPARVDGVILSLRRVPFLSSRIADSAPEWSSGLAAERITLPVTDLLGRPIWIDRFRTVRQLRFVRAKGGAPFLSLPIVQAGHGLVAGPLGAGKSIRIGGGSLWIATDAVSAAPSGRFTGVRIAGGTLTASTDLELGEEEIVVPTGAEIALSVKLEPPKPTDPVPGSEFESTDVTFPEGLDLRLAPGVAALSARGAAGLTVWGAEVALDPAGGAAVYRADLNRLVVPMKPDAATLSARQVVSDHFMPEGRAPIAGAGLALPVATILPADLGEAAGVGALLLDLEAGLDLRIVGEPRAVAMGKATLMLDASRLAMTAAKVPSAGEIHRVKVPVDPAFDVTTSRRNGAAVNYFTGPDGIESVASEVSADLRPPLPVTVRGDRSALRLPQAVLLVVRAADGTRRFTLSGFTAPAGPGAQDRAFGLKNAVLRASEAFGAIVSGSFDGDAAVPGGVLAGYVLKGLLPTLPDPYATTLALTQRFGVGSRGILVSGFSWQGGAGKVTFTLPEGTTFDGIGTAAPQSAVMAGASDRAGAFEQLGQMLDFERDPKAVLLDVSTAAGRFGVAIRPPRDRESLDTSPLTGPQIRDLELEVDGRFITLLALPAVQWEPVRNVPGPEPFPDEVRFLNSGVPTVIDVPAVTLVPLHPGAAYRKLVDNFALPTPRPSRARFTLPFGMIADARLGPTFSGRSADLGEARPKTADGMEGAPQLRIDARDPTLGPGETPAMPGATLQLPVAIPTGGGPAISVLGTSPTSIFNTSLGPTGSDPLVPLTRIDLASHGSSTMSAWANPNEASVAVSKAEFQILNGRVAHEVVQVRSFLMPNFAPVVRTITFERRGSGLVQREDTGWVAVRDGDYRNSAGIVVHPGAVLRAPRITNIRETGTKVSAGGLDFMAVRFDSDLVLSGAASPVPARRHEGWVQITALPTTSAAYAELIGKVGPMGGAIDTTIAIGGGRQKMRLHRIGVGVAGGEFAMAAWGSPVFPQGEWSVLEAAGSAEAPAPVAEDRGLPLIRQGAAGAATSAAWRFADPEDLLDPANPGRDYGLLHSMGTQRAFFRRPRIEPAAPHRIVSTERPVLADPFVLATAVGPFPRQADAIPFPTAAFAIEARPDGSWRLDGPPTFTAGVPRRTVRSAGTVRSDLDYAAAKVTYAFDTADATPWRFVLEGARKIMAHTSMGDLMIAEATIDAAAGRQTAFADPKTMLTGPFDIVNDLLTIMKDLGLAAEPEVRMTNGWSLKIGQTIPFVDAMGEDLKVIPGEPFPTIKFADTGVKVEVTVAPDNDSALLEIGGSPMFAIKSIPGLYVVAIIKFKLGVSTKYGTTYGILIGVGIAYTLEAGPFELKGLFAITFFAVFGDSGMGYGVGFLVKVSADLPPIVSIEISLEGKLARLTAKPGTAEETVFCAAKLTFAIEVSIFLVFSISLEVETKQIDILRGPLGKDKCPELV
jgi:hypothetical protein